MKAALLHDRIKFEHGYLGYIQAGEGRNVILAFPGYGRSAKDFEVLAEHLPADHSLLAIDYFGEGDSVLDNPESIISLKELNDLIRRLPAVKESESIILLGYSLGGRVVMTLFNHSQENISRIILLAPDGLKRNPVHYFLSGTSAGRALFAFSSEHPKIISSIVKGITNLKLINDKLGKFVLSNTSNSGTLNKVRLTWKNFAVFWPNLKQFKKLVDKTNTPVTLVMGKHDRIIKPVFANYLLNPSSKHVKTFIAEGGHDLIKQGFPFADWLK